MKEQLLKVARQGHFFDKHNKVLVAVSGGKDSLALLHLLQDLKNQLGIILGVAHVNYGQRSASDQEEAYVKQLADQLGLSFYRTQFTGNFTEEKARVFRYTFFREIMDSEGYTALVTAHHADDQAETVFMRLLRGGRLLDMQGIQAVQPFGQGELIRPLLSFSKEELPEFFHFEDESNSQPTYLRNRIRHHYLPLLEKENPQFKKSLQQFGQEVATLKTALSELTKDIPLEDTEIFQRQAPAVQEFLLQHYLEQFPELQLKNSHFQQLLSMLRGPKAYQIPLKDGYSFSKNAVSYQIASFSPQTDDRIAPVCVEYGQSVTVGGVTFSFGIPLEESVQEWVVDRDKSLLIRTRKPGDVLLLNGLHKKVRRYFIDKKIEKALRRTALLVEQEGQIYGIAKMVTSDLSKSDKRDIMKATLYIK